MKTKKLLVLFVVVAMLFAMVATIVACTPTTEPHKCEDVCTTCQKCTSDCTDPACADKCQGHTPAAHECNHVCPTCKKCTDTNCKDDACKDKCQGHTPVAHECKHVCETCGKCTDKECKDPACASKCQGHEPPVVEHECKHVCETCGKCTDTCTDPACEEKCEGHEDEPIPTGNLELKKDNLFEGLTGTSYATYDGDHKVNGYKVTTKDVLGNANNGYDVLQFKKQTGTLTVTGKFVRIVYIIETSFSNFNNITVYVGDTKVEITESNYTSENAGKTSDGKYDITLYTVTIDLEATDAAQEIKFVNESGNAVYVTSINLLTEIPAEPGCSCDNCAEECKCGEGCECDCCQEEVCEHDYEGQPYVSDKEGNHYQLCSKCQEPGASEACEVTTYVSKTDAKHVYKCTKCDYQVESNHDYTTGTKFNTCKCEQEKVEYVLVFGDENYSSNADQIFADEGDGMYVLKYVFSAPCTFKIKLNLDDNGASVLVELTLEGAEEEDVLTYEDGVFTVLKACTIDIYLTIEDEVTVEVEISNVAEEHVHDYTEYRHDDNQHWMVCPEDESEKDGSRAAHKYDQEGNAKCVCGVAIKGEASGYTLVGLIGGVDYWGGSDGTGMPTSLKLTQDAEQTWIYRVTVTLKGNDSFKLKTYGVAWDNGQVNLGYEGLNNVTALSSVDLKSHTLKGDLIYNSDGNVAVSKWVETMSVIVTFNFATKKFDIEVQSATILEEVAETEYILVGAFPEAEWATSTEVEALKFRKTADNVYTITYSFNANTKFRIKTNESGWNESYGYSHLGTITKGEGVTGELPTMFTDANDSNNMISVYACTLTITLDLNTKKINVLVDSITIPESYWDAQGYMLVGSINSWATSTTNSAYIFQREGDTDVGKLTYTFASGAQFKIKSNNGSWSGVDLGYSALKNVTGGNKADYFNSSGSNISVRKACTVIITLYLSSSPYFDIEIVTETAASASLSAPVEVAVLPEIKEY